MPKTRKPVNNVIWFVQTETTLVTMEFPETMDRFAVAVKLTEKGYPGNAGFQRALNTLPC
jgi:hypothetical protein